MEQIYVFRVRGLPRGITTGVAYNLIWTFPGLAAYNLQLEEEEPVLTVNIAGGQLAQYFCRTVHGRPYDTSIPDSAPLVVECCGQVSGAQLAGFQFAGPRLPGPEPDVTRHLDLVVGSSGRSTESNTLYGRGITDDECPKYVEEELWRTGLEGITDVRVVRRYSTHTSLVFVDFGTPAQARTAERKWRHGIVLKTGLCKFSVSRHGRSW